MIPKFKKGDLVKYELSSYGHPRWSYDSDYNGSGKWYTATVLEVTDRQITTTVPEFKETEAFLFIPNMVWSWPNIAAASYNLSQWKRPGFLCHLQKEPDQETFYNPMDRFKNLEV